VRVRVEIGAGEYPDPDYDLHTDILPLPGIQVLCRLDRLPFVGASLNALRANHVLEHQSYEAIDETVAEWARVLRPGATIDIGVPDAKFVAQQWVRGEIDTHEANYWILGGHSDRPAHRGTDANGTPRWIWNAHHTMFDDALLREVVEGAGFADICIRRYDIRNLRCTAVRC
jgi:predicted SAM-dependent methyltransferase